VRDVQESSVQIFEYLQLFDTRFATSLPTLHSTASVAARVIGVKFPLF